MNPRPDPLRTTREAASQFSVTRATVINWIKSRRLRPVLTLPKSYRIPQSTIDAFKRSCQ
jgi:excisionase family DNA binding protein